MKIEKINDNQIRCTLTRQDLADREIKLSELAYGTEKAKLLFRDMMQQAAYEFGFEANDIPLMIEAIPISSDSVILIVTKVEDPEELDTRFAKFSPSNGEENNNITPPAPAPLEGADDILNLFNKIHEARKMAENAAAKTSEKKEKDSCKTGDQSGILSFDETLPFPRSGHCDPCSTHSAKFLPGLQHAL